MPRYIEIILRGDTMRLSILIFCLFLSILSFLIAYHKEKKLQLEEVRNRRKLVDDPSILFQEEEEIELL